MAQFVRGRQAGVGTDFSAGLIADTFGLDFVARYGINSQTSALAYDPVQSLLALGTKESRFGSGQIYVFGQKRVCAVFTPQRKCSIERLQFCADNLICTDSRNDLTIYSLRDQKIAGQFAPPGRITAITTDPALDYVFIGLQNGQVVTYDMEHRCPAPFRIQDLWREFDSRARMVSVVSLALHPRDVGTLLISYTEGALIFSFKQNKPLQFFRYDLPPGAPGGGGDPTGAGKARSPKLVHAAWHPTGTFILTGHEDGSLVIWDPKTAQVVQARTLQNANVNQRGATGAFGAEPGAVVPKVPLFKIAWCAKQNPDDTGILVAGGESSDAPDRGLTFIELGPTPNYSTSSWQILGDHFARPKNKSTLPIPPDTDVLDFCLIPRSSPYFAGAQDPLAVICVLNSGELITMSFPSGHPISPTNQYHPSISFVHPFINSVGLSNIDKTRWLGMTERRPAGPPLVAGGAEGTRNLKRFEDRNVLLTAHVDGTVRIWDAGNGDEIENPDTIQVDVGGGLGRTDDVDVTQMSLAGKAGEFAAGLRSGEVIIFRWERNPNFGRDMQASGEEKLGLIDVQDNADSGLKEGFLPLTMFPGTGAPCTTIVHSPIGFCAAGFENGALAVIDLRGPALIFSGGVAETGRAEQKRGFRRSNSQAQPGRPEWATTMEFGIMSLEDEGYSSILLFVGTNQGRVLTFKVVPESNGAYSVKPAGSASVEDPVVMIQPLNAQTGQSAHASQQAYGSLREGKPLDGVIVVATRGGARIFKPAAARGASKSWSDVFCDRARVVRSEDRTALLGLFGDGTAKTFSIPGLKEMSSMRLDQVLDVRRFAEAVISNDADVIAWTGPSEIAIVNPWGAGLDSSRQNDRLINPNVALPPRPTISNVQWISGTQYVTPADMDTLIGGPDRPPSQRALDQMGQQGGGGGGSRGGAARAGGSSSTARAGVVGAGVGAGAGAGAAAAGGAAPGKQDEGYVAYMSRQVQERTERLNLMGDTMERLEDQSSRWADDVSKFVSSQKKKAAMGMVTSKFGF